MIPNMYKIAGELTSAVMHVAARSLAAQGLSIFGDHSDVMAVRQTGFALLAVRLGPGGPRPRAGRAGGDARHPGALRALLRRLPHLARAEHDRAAHRRRPARAGPGGAGARAPRPGLSPERPFIRGTAQNPDVYFQARETVNPFYARVPEVVQDVMARSASARAALSAWSTTAGDPRGGARAGGDGVRRGDRAETVAALNERGERVGVVQVRLYRP